MDFLHQVKLSFTFYWNAYRFIDRHHIWRIIILPAIINLIIAFIIIVFAIKSSRFIVDTVLDNSQLNTSEESTQKYVEGFLMIFVRALVFFLYLKLYRYIILIVLAPIFTIISSKIQQLDTGIPENLRTSKFFMNFGRGIKVACRNFIVEIILSTLIVAISFITAWIIPLAPIIILLLESYFMGYSMADYRNEYYKLSSKESRKLINKYPGLVMGNGIFFNLLLLIPVIGVLAAPVLALVASGLSINYIEKRKSILCDSDQSTLMMAKS